MRHEHKVIIVPGLDDRSQPIVSATRAWVKHGLTPEVVTLGWQDHSNDLERKLSFLLQQIDNYRNGGHKVSLVGISAGGSATVNAFLDRREEIHRVINVCGRLRTGSLDGFRTLVGRSSKSPAFFESVKLFERQEKELSSRDRLKIMTVRALFGDQLVPADTTILEGSTNITIPTIEHVISIYASLTVFSQPLISFLKSGKV